MIARTVVNLGKQSLDLVPLATCGTALTDAHLDLLAPHTDLHDIILGFDADTAGRNATLAAGRKLGARGLPAAAVTLLATPAGTDAAAILEQHGPERFADILADPRPPPLGALIDNRLDSYAWSTTTSRCGSCRSPIRPRMRPHGCSRTTCASRCCRAA